ncbi:cell wall-active antibiotics response protein [Peribacillus saganii]|uniref:Cell wall-active antibiotics response protein n=1 Tax=Peribacillus saganii TaxID=2303992 RepID=A0A372LPI5_9BACI|nr:cell wall-active antibiotics response protein LiaF [Peribacillus saganii]RFU69142.1 cell wall-active antibiotics response protein [Peribacillus saganii]
MFKNMKTDLISWILLIGLIVLVLEISFFDGGLIFSLLISAGCIYIGRKKRGRTIGSVLFWLGVIMAVVTVMNMMAFKFFIMAILAYILFLYIQSRKEPEKVEPTVKKPVDKPLDMVIKKPLLGNKLFGHGKTPDHVYEWNDINIQTGIGDTVIDLSNTVLPKGEAIISIRSFIGNIKIFIPYEMEVSVHHSVLAGTAEILQHQEKRIFNQNMSVQTPDYENAEQKVKILTSLISGNLEVKRI